MKRSCFGVIKVVLSLGIAFGVAFTAYAQAQTPTAPRDTRGLTTNQRTRQQQQQQESPAATRLGERLRALREGQEEPAPAPGAPPPPARPAVTAPGVARTPPGVIGAPDAVGAPGVRTTGAVPAAGIPGAAAMGVRVVGPPTYDPLFQREVVYGEVPEMPDVEPFTLAGPMTVGDFLETMNLFTDWNVLVTEQARTVILNFWVADVTPAQAMEILRFHDIWYGYEEQGNYLRVMTKLEYLEQTYGGVVEAEFVVEHANVEYIESVLQSLMSPSGRMLVDPRTGNFFVWDRAQNLDRMDLAMEQLDVPLMEAEFQVTHANVADIEAIITSLLSPGGTMITDPRTGRIVAKDMPDNISRMRTAMGRFDVPLTPRTFRIQHMNADALVDAVQALLTPERGMLQMDPRTNTMIVTDLPARQEQIAAIIDTLDRPQETRTWVLAYIEPDVVAERIENLVPEEMGNIVVDDTVHQLTVTATAERIEEIDQMIRMWDVKRKQVLIEAHLVTLGSNLARSFNINWSYFDTIDGTPIAYRVGAGARPDYANLSETLTVGQLPRAQVLRSRFSGEPLLNIRDEEIITNWRGDRLAATLNYLDTKGQVTILSSPRVTVQDGAEAMFQSGRNVPYVTSTTYDYGARTRTTDPTDPTQQFGVGYRPFNRIEFIEVGTILTVLPRISADGSILLEIAAEDSDAIPVTVVSDGQENTIPEKTVSLAETQVRVNDGQTIVIGGLRRGNSTESVSRAVPLLSDIPIVGALFRSPVKNIQNDSLMIFLTTTIVSEDTHPEAERLATAEESFAEKLRTAEKTQLARLWDSVTRGTNEISVSIGQSGDMHSGGQRVTLNDLRTVFHYQNKPQTTRVIIRSHPRAPKRIVSEVTELALEAQLKVEFDDRLIPFVPSYAQPHEPAAAQQGMTPLPQPPPPAEVRVPARAERPLVIRP